MKLFYIGILVATMADFTTAANILGMLPLPLYSHTNNYLPIFKELTARGHNVTLVSPFPQKKPLANFTEIIVPDIFEKLLASVDEQVNFIELDGLIFDLVGLWLFATKAPKMALELEPIQRLIKDEHSKFDLIIVETWFIQEVFVAFGHKFNAPVINFAAISLTPQAAYLTGNDLPASYVPVPKLPYSDHMNFGQRLWNSFYTLWDISIGNIYLMMQDTIMREYFKYPGSENLPYIGDLLRNTSLTLMDTRFATNYPLPVHKNVIEFGGINIKKPEKLPNDIQKFIDNAPEGVLYFTFGSHLNFSLIKPETQKAIISAFGKVKQKVMMKVEEGNPYLELAKSKNNILVKSWFPQASVLAHPKCKIFVTHGGLHGLMEGVYNAVPMVAIPLIADQKFNAKFIETTGIGKVLKLKEVTEDLLLQAIQDVLNNPSYREKISERSAIFKDTPINTMDNVIYWIEYIIRHKGAPHLRPAVLDLYWFQRFMLDIIAFYVVILLAIIYIIKIIIVSCCKFLKWLFKGKKQVSVKSKKKTE